MNLPWLAHAVKKTNRQEALWRLGLRSAGILTLLILWEWFGRTHNNLLLAPPSDVIPRLSHLLRSNEIYEALWISNQALFIGYAMAVVLAVPLGLLLGRVPWLDRFSDGYLTILMVTPISALIPIVIVAVGLGLTARVVLVFLFCFPIMVINSRAGLRRIDNSLIDMARAFNAGEGQIWKHVLLPSAMPGVMAGLQLGLARALTGMIIVELIMIAAGLGKLILRSMSLFEPETTYALIIIIIVEIMVLMNLFRWLCRRNFAWRDV